MKLSKKGEYALRALLALAHNAKTKQPHVLSLKEISHHEEIPLKFLEHIMAILKRGNIVRSEKGQRGGYALARPANKIIIGEIIRLVDGPLSPLTSAEELKDMIRKGKKDSGIYSIMLDVRNSIANILDNVSLEDLLQRSADLVKAKDQYEMYYI